MSTSFVAKILLSLLANKQKPFSYVEFISRSRLADSLLLVPFLSLRHSLRSWLFILQNNSIFCFVLVCHNPLLGDLNATDMTIHISSVRIFR